MTARPIWWVLPLTYGLLWPLAVALLMICRYAFGGSGWIDFSDIGLGFALTAITPAVFCTTLARDEATGERLVTFKRALLYTFLVSLPHVLAGGFLRWFAEDGSAAFSPRILAASVVCGVVCGLVTHSARRILPPDIDCAVYPSPAGPRKLS